MSIHDELTRRAVSPLNWEPIRREEQRNAEIDARVGRLCAGSARAQAEAREEFRSNPNEYYRYLNEWRASMGWPPYHPPAPPMKTSPHEVLVCP